jgi:hypothetical protein
MRFNARDVLPEKKGLKGVQIKTSYIEDSFQRREEVIPDA